MSAPTSDPVDDPTVHELLLALAGRLDDDLLAWARELVAVGEEGQAVELATAALAAERVALPPALRAAAVAAARAAHTDLNVERELAPAVLRRRDRAPVRRRGRSRRPRWRRCSRPCLRAGSRDARST